MDFVEHRTSIVLTCLFNILTEDGIAYIGEIAVNGLTSC